MGQEKSKLRTALEWTAIAGSVGGSVAVGASWIDAHSAQTGIDLLSGISPLQADDGTVSLKHVLRDLRSLPSEDVPRENYTPLQNISSWGAGLTFLAVMFGHRPVKSMGVGGSWTLATLGGYKFLETLAQSPNQDLSSLVFYGGAASVMYAAGLVQLMKEPTNHIQTARDSLEKAKSIARRFRKKKDS